MDLQKRIMEMIKKRNYIDALYYLQGNIRYFMYYSKFCFLIRKHIREQIEYRIEWMNSICYKQGSCDLCGCETTALQMCNKSCDRPCYPQMMDTKQWRNYNLNRQISFDKGQTVWLKDGLTGKPLLFIWNEIMNSYVQSQSN